MMPKSMVCSVLAFGAMYWALHLGGFKQGLLSLLDLHTLIAMMMAFLLAILNFRRAELVTTVTLILRRRIGRPAEIAQGLQVVGALWRYQTFSLSFLWLLMLLNTMVHEFAGHDVINGLGHLLAVAMIAGLYLTMLSLFVVMPARGSLQKQLIRDDRLACGR